MTKSRKKTTRRIYLMRRLFILLPIIVIVSIPLFKLVNIFLLRIEYVEAIYSNNRALANMIYAQRLSMAGFLYNLPTFAKAILGLILLLIWGYGLHLLLSPLRTPCKKKNKKDLSN